jgi:hypothetical protein
MNNVALLTLLIIKTVLGIRIINTMMCVRHKRAASSINNFTNICNQLLMIPTILYNTNSVRGMWINRRTVCILCGPEESRLCSAILVSLPSFQIVEIYIVLHVIHLL